MMDMTVGKLRLRECSGGIELFIDGRFVAKIDVIDVAFLHICTDSMLSVLRLNSGNRVVELTAEGGVRIL